jgi:hypothetical protein
LIIIVIIIVIYYYCNYYCNLLVLQFIIIVIYYYYYYYYFIFIIGSYLNIFVTKPQAGFEGRTVEWHPPHTEQFITPFLVANWRIMTKPRRAGVTDRDAEPRLS